MATLTEVAPPQTRSHARRTSTTQNHSSSPAHKHQKKISVQETPLPSLFIEGMNIDQIWQQLDLRAARVCENLQVLQGENEDEDAILEGEDSDSDGDGDENENGEEGEAAEMDVDDDENLWEGLSCEENDVNSTAESVVSLQEEDSEDDGEDHDGPSFLTLDTVRGQEKLSPLRSHSQGHSDLDDGFFNLAAFNAETSGVEAKVLSKRKLDLVADEDSAEESEVDLFASLDGLETTDVGDGLGE